MISPLSEIRSRHPAISTNILNITRLHRSIRPSGRRADGVELYDEEMLVTAATVNACEADLRARSTGPRSDARLRNEQYADAAARLHL